KRRSTMILIQTRKLAGDATGTGGDVSSSTVSPPMSNVFQQLMSVLEDRKINPPPNSYTARLYAGGDAKIGAKIAEEAHELVEAAGETGDQGRRHIIYE